MLSVNNVYLMANGHCGLKLAKNLKLVHELVNDKFLSQFFPGTESRSFGVTKSGCLTGANDRLFK